MSDKSSADFDQSPVQLYPPWRHAVKCFLEYEFRAGDIVTHEWLCEKFGIPFVNPDVPMPPKEYDALRIRYLAQMKTFRTFILEEYKVDLRSKHGIGYVVIEAREQAEKAYEDMEREIRKAVRKGARRVINVDFSQLTNEESQDYRRQLEKFGVFKSMMRKARRQLMLPERRGEDE